MKKTTKKTGIFKKMSKQILVPFACILVIISILILMILNIKIDDLRESEISAKSSYGASNIDSFFKSYYAMAAQLASVPDLYDLMSSMKAGDDMFTYEKLDELQEIFIAAADIDKEHIGVTWFAAYDASQLWESGGFSTKSGEWDVTTRGWYKEMQAAQTTIITEPYTTTAGELVASIISPVFNENKTKILGVAGIDLDLSILDNMMKGYTLGKTGYYVLYTSGGNIIYHPDSKNIQKSISDLDISDNVKSSLLKHETGFYKYKDSGKSVYSFVSEVGDTGWMVLTGLPSSEYREVFNTICLIIVIVFLISGFVIIFNTVRTAKGIVKPLEQLEKIADEIANGDLNIDIKVESNDEIGQVAASLDHTVIRLKDYIIYINEISEILEEIADGNLNFELKNEYIGDFKKIKDALMDNVQNFLMELGTGFAFVGREYRLQVGNTEQYIDMLFYNTKRHCYIVVEVKVVEFEPGYISQTATYVSAVNHTLKGKEDTQTIGLLICKTKDNILAKCAVETSTEPIGISEYELNALMPKDFKGTLPTIEELEQGLSEDTVN